MTYRERRERRAARLREWAERRVERATTTLEADRAHYAGDVAFNTQPGHIPERARVLARTDRALESLGKAERMDGRADNIEAQLDVSIYSDDPDAIERLADRIAGLEAERERIKRFNATARKGQPDESILDDRQRENLARCRSAGSVFLGPGGSFPAYHLSNLSGNIARQRARLDDLRRRAGAA